MEELRERESRRQNKGGVVEEREVRRERRTLNFVTAIKKNGVSPLSITQIF